MKRESWSNKDYSESDANIEIALSDHEKKHEHQLCDQTNEMEESIIHKEKCEKEDVVCEETKIECEFKNNESVEVIEVNKECLQSFEQSSKVIQKLPTQEVAKSAPCYHEEYIHHEEEKLEVCAQKKKEDKELIIHPDYTNNFHLSFLSVLNVIF